MGFPLSWGNPGLKHEDRLGSSPRLSKILPFAHAGVRPGTWDPRPARGGRRARRGRSGRRSSSARRGRRSHRPPAAPPPEHGPRTYYRCPPRKKALLRRETCGGGKLSEDQIRWWRAGSAAGLQGEGVHEGVWPIRMLRKSCFLCSGHPFLVQVPFPF